MTEPITRHDAAIILEDIAVNWRALPENQQDHWTRELIGRNMSYAVAALEEIKQQGSEHPPTWAHFNARYMSKVNALRAVAETEERVDQLLDTTDNPGRSTHVRLCMAWCRRVTADDKGWRVALFGAGGMPGWQQFDATMRSVAGVFDGLPDGPFDERADTAVAQYVRGRA